jgi:hypothetical protein
MQLRQIGYIETNLVSSIDLHGAADAAGKKAAVLSTAQVPKPVVLLSSGWSDSSFTCHVCSLEDKGIDTIFPYRAAWTQ